MDGDVSGTGPGGIEICARSGFVVLRGFFVFIIKMKSPPHTHTHFS